MRTIIIALFLLVSGWNITSAQGHEKIKAAMVSLFTERMELTADQAKRFWPVYNQYETEKRNIQRQISAAKKSGDASAVKKVEQLENEILQLKGKYKNNFLQIISVQQLAKMYSAEEEFKKMLLNRMNED